MTTWDAGCVLLRQGFGELLFEAQTWKYLSEVEWFCSAPSASGGGSYAGTIPTKLKHESILSGVEWYIGSVKQSHKVTKCDVVTSGLVTDKNEVKMNWFRKKQAEDKGQGDARSSMLDTRAGHRESSIKHRASNFDAAFFLFLAFAGLFLLKAGIPQSVPVSFSDVRPLKVEPKADSDRNPDPDARFTRPGSRLSESERRDRAESERRDSSGGAVNS